MKMPYIFTDEIKYCKRCGRRLKGEEAKQRGYGKSCWEKSQVPNNKSGLFKLYDMGVDK